MDLSNYFLFLPRLFPTYSFTFSIILVGFGLDNLFLGGWGAGFCLDNLFFGGWGAGFGLDNLYCGCYKAGLAGSMLVCQYEVDCKVT